MAEPIELSNFLKWIPPKLDPVISNGLMYAGSRMIIFGKYKSLKSMTTTRLCLAISRGEEWLDFKTEQRDVLYLQLEVPGPMLHNRVSKMTSGVKDSKGKLWLWTEPALRLDSDVGFGLLENYLKELKPQVLAIDPIYKVVQLGETAHIQDFVDRVDYLVDKYGLSLILVHHTRKGEREKEWGNADDMLDSSIFLNWADTVIRVERESERSIAVSFDIVRHAEEELKKRHFELDGNTLQFNSANGKRI